MNYRISISLQQGNKILITRSEYNAWTIVDQTQFDVTDTANICAFAGIDAGQLAAVLSSGGAALAIPDAPATESTDVTQVDPNATQVIDHPEYEGL